jgi:hypothetical protein
MKGMRRPTLREERLLRRLIETASRTILPHWKDELWVSRMNDGEMGSLCLFPNGQTHNGRVFGERVSEFQFVDQDGVTVIVSLNVDTQGDLFELDVWKTDFNPLISFPDS